MPYLGDSQKHKNKARGYLYPVKADMNFKCHNCGASSTFSNFVKTLDPVLYKQYIFEKFKTRNTGKGSIFEEPKFDFKKPVFKKSLDLPRASEIPIATKYLEKRKIDPHNFYFTKEFQKWTNTHKQTFDTIHRDESRVIIPLHDTEKNLIGFQGRSLGPNSVKYITVMLNEDAPKIYGLDKINEKNQSTLPKDHSTRPLWKTRLLCAVPILILGRLVGAIIFGFLITNLATEKSSNEYPTPLTKESKSLSGQLK